MTSKADKAWQDYSIHFRREVVPKLLSSGVFLSIGERSEALDVQQATEIGAALLLDKPIMVVARKGQRLSEHLRRAADMVVEDFDPADPHAQDRIVAAMHELTERFSL